MTNTPDISLPGAYDTKARRRGPDARAAVVHSSISLQPAYPPETEPSVPVELAPESDTALPERATVRKESPPLARLEPLVVPPKPEPPVEPEGMALPTPLVKPKLPVLPARLALPTTPPQPAPPAVPSEPAPPAIPPQPAPPVALARPGPQADRAEPPRGRDLAAAQIRRLALLAVTIVLLGTGAGLLGTLVWPATYAARAEILYPVSQNGPTGSSRDDRNLATQLVLLQGRAVLGPVAQGEGRAVEDLEDDVTVQVVETSEVIQIEARASSRDVAMSTLQAVVDRYFALESAAQPSGVREYLDGELATAQSGIADVRGRLTQLQSEAAAGIGSSAAVTAADNELQTLLSRKQNIQTQLDDLKITSASGLTAQLLTPAYHVPDPVSPRPLFAGGTGALIGLIVAAGAVALAARRWIRT